MSSEQESKAADSPDAEKSNTVVKLNSPTKAKSNTATRDLNKRFTELEQQITGVNEQLENSNLELKKISKMNTSSKTLITKKIQATVTQLESLEGNYRTLMDDVSSMTDEVTYIRQQASQTSSLQEQLKSELQDKADQLGKQIKSLELRIDTRIKDNGKVLVELKKSIASDQQNMQQRLNKAETGIELHSSDIEELRVADKQISETSAKRADEINQKLTRSAASLESSIGQVQQNLNSQFSELNTSIQAASQTILNHEQRLDQHKATDDALDERTTSLENTTGRLGQQTIKLENAADKLEQQSKQLLQAVSGLNDKTGELQTTTETQGAQIVDLDQREKGHFKLLSGGLLALTLIGAGAYIYEKGLWQADNLQNKALQQQIMEQQTALSSTSTQQMLIQQELSDLRELLSENKQQVNTDIQVEKTAMLQQIETLKNKLKDVNDGVETLDGRMVARNPLGQFGGDNTIHGSHWLARQNPKHFSIEISGYSKKQDLYTTARRYSYYLQQKLAWYSTGTGKNTRYVLVYGLFNDQASAASDMRRLPVRQARIVQMSEIQSRL